MEKASDAADSNYITTPKGGKLSNFFFKKNNLILQWKMNKQGSAQQSSLQKNGGSCIRWRLLHIWVQRMKYIGEHYNAYENRMRTRHYRNSHLTQGSKVYATGVKLFRGRYDTLGVCYATRRDIGRVLPSRERHFLPKGLERRGCTTAGGAQGSKAEGL